MRNYWLILHDYEAYREEPSRIGKELRKKGKIEKVRKGDQVLYYAIGDREVVASFDVTSNGYKYIPENSKTNKKWVGETWAYNIKQRGRNQTHPVPLHEIKSKLKLKSFPKESIAFKDRTAIQISRSDFQKIERLLYSYAPPSNFFQGRANEGNLGEPIDLRILNYAPTSEQAVVVLFAEFMREIDFNFVKLEFVRNEFPDACVIQKTSARTFARKYIEFEFKASGFRDHMRNPHHREIQCDYVVCWENDFPNCPIPVIELKKEIGRILSFRDAQAA